MSIMQYAQTSSNTPLKTTSFYLWLEKRPYLSGGFLIGSVARGDEDFRSDIDISLLADYSYNKDLFEVEIRNFWGDQLLSIIYIERKQSFTIFLNDLNKFDLKISIQKADLLRNFKESFIPLKGIPEIILFDKNNELNVFLTQHHIEIPKDFSKEKISPIIDNFLISFEACSRNHAKSDSYRFYFNYNIAFHAANQLKYIATGNFKFVHSPRFFPAKALVEEEKTIFPTIAASLDLRIGNQQKRQLLNWTYASINSLLPERLSEVKRFCETIFKRDYFWNFRDYAQHTKLKKGLIFRSSSLSLHKNSDEIVDLLKQNGICHIVDMRAPREIEKQAYSKKILTQFEYVTAPFDPWNQPTWFEEKHHQGDNRSIAYRFFLIACQASFKITVKAILQSKGAIVIHCHAGKDRTGLFIGALHLLMGVPEKQLLADYLASGSDAHEPSFRMLLDEVDKRGGIEAYFAFQGIEEQDILQLKKKLAQ